MSGWKNGASAALLAGLALMPQWAAAETASVPAPVIIQRNYGAAEDPGRFKAVAERAGNLFTLLMAEMALQRGDASRALGTYMLMLERTKDTEVAERAMDMAVGLNAFDQADAVYRRWVELEPSPGAALQRMTWARNMVRGDFSRAAEDWDTALSEANDIQQQRIFLLAAQTAVQRPELAQILEEKVHRSALERPQMPEAAMADAILSALTDQDRRAVDALQRLAVLDGEMLPPTELTLRLIGQRKPEILGRLFQSTDTQHLSPVWRELQLSGLVFSGKTDEAAALLQKLLAEDPDAELYIQAALLEASRNGSRAQVENYLQKAYQTGSKEQQSRAALVAVLGALENNQYPQAAEWLKRIQSGEYAFDKLFLQASLAGEQGDWPQVRRVIAQAQALPSQEGRFFSGDDLFGLHLAAMANEKNAQNIVPQLNRLYREAQKSGNTDREADVLYQRGLLYADRLNNPRAAVADFRRLLELRPNAEAMNALGYTMLLVPGEDQNRAFELIQTAYSQDPESPAINDSMGWAYFKKGDAAAALPYLQYAFEQFPHGEVAAHLGEVLWTLGEKAKAQAVFKQGLAAKEGAEIVRATVRRLGIKLPAR